MGLILLVGIGFRLKLGLRIYLFIILWRIFENIRKFN